MNKYHKILSALVIFLTAFAFSSCSWVKDDTDDCPNGIWLQMQYDYNMLDVDAVKLIDDATVFVYDSLGNYVRKMEITKAQLEANDYRIDVSSLPEGYYDFVVWAGAEDSHYSIRDAQDLSLHHLALLTDRDASISENIGDLYYGGIQRVYIGKQYAVHPLKMIKDTNRIVCIVENESEEDPISVSYYTMQIVANNGLYNAYNDPVPSNTNATLSGVYYNPYSEEDVEIDDIDLGPHKAARFGFNTLRLIEHDNTRLILKEKESGNEVFNIPMTEYLAQVSELMLIKGRTPSVQEYLDRQDQHTFIICLSSDPNNKNAIMRCKVNNWILRTQEKVEL